MTSHSGGEVKLVDSANERVGEVMDNYNMGLITNERYNRSSTSINTNLLTNILMERLETDKQGFNSIYTMMHPEPVVPRSRSAS